MNTPFKKGNRITQEYGKKPAYYQQFGFAGHEGLDIVSLDGDRSVYAVEGGVVVRDVDPGERFDGYGYLVVILNKETRHAWWYAHNSTNIVEPGDVIKRGQKIADFGGSGNTKGDHLHLGLRLADANGVALNTVNPMKGFVNPAPYLDELNSGSVIIGPINNMSQLTEEIYNKSKEVLPDQSYNFEDQLDTGRFKDGLAVVKVSSLDQEKEWRSNRIKEINSLNDQKRLLEEKLANIPLPTSPTPPTPAGELTSEEIGWVRKIINWFKSL